MRVNPQAERREVFKSLDFRFYIEFNAFDNLWTATLEQTDKSQIISQDVRTVVISQARGKDVRAVVDFVISQYFLMIPDDFVDCCVEESIIKDHVTGKSDFCSVERRSHGNCGPAGNRFRPRPKRKRVSLMKRLFPFLFMLLLTATCHGQVIVSPSNTIAITYEATDNIAIVSSRVLIDDNEIATFPPDPSNHYSIPWTTPTEGTHIIRVEATDEAGNVGFDEVTVTVDGGIPQVIITIIVT